MNSQRQRGPPRADPGVGAAAARPPPLRFAVAIVAPLLALGLTLSLSPGLDRTPLALFFLAVVLVGWYGGFGPSLFAALVSVLAAEYFVYPPAGSFAISRDDALGFAVFVASACVVGAVTGSLHRARRRAEVEGLQNAELVGRLEDAQQLAHLGSWEWDIRANEVRWSDELYRLYGLEPQEFGATFEAYLERVRPEDREHARRIIGAARQDGRPFELEERIVRPDGSERVLRSRGQAIRDEAGEAIRMVGVCHDVTAEKAAEERALQIVRVEAARAEAETAARRLAFLAEASAELGASLDFARTLRNVARLAVPTLGDWFGVHLVEEDGTIRPVAVESADPAQAEVASALRDRYSVPGDGADHAVARAIRSGATQVSETSDAAMTAAALDDEHARLLRATGMRSYVVAPLTAAGRVFGALACAHAESGRTYTAADVALIEDLARRAGTAIHNALLVRDLEAGQAKLERQAAELRNREALLERTLERLEQTTAALRASNEALEREAAERERVQRSLRESEARLSAFLEQLPLGVGMLDMQGRWIIRNPALGRFAHELIPSRDPDGATRWRSWASDGSLVDPSEWPGARALRGEVVTSGMDFLYTMEDGTALWTRVSAAPFRDHAGEVVGAIVVIEDVDEQKQAGARLEAVGQIAQALLRHTRLDDVLHELLDRLRVVLGVDEATVLLDLEEETALRVRAARGIEEEAARSVRVPFGQGMAGRVAATRQPMIVPDLSEVQVVNPYLRESMRSLVAVPLLVDDRVLGVLHVGTATPRAFTRDDLLFLELVAERVVSIIERARLHEAERAARAEAEAARRTAEAANRAKADFLAVISHDLRTPLNAIMGYAQLLEMEVHGSLNEPQRKALAGIQQNQQRVLALMTGLLDFARLEAGQVTYQLVDVPLDPALAALEAAISPQLQGKGLLYAYHPCDPAFAVRADREKMEQVLLNLLTNAIKFTDRDGRITLEAGAAEEQIAIHVRDTGRGIPRDKLASIFEPFVQLDGQATRNLGGVGLGLTIVRELSRAMGGDVTAESVLGQGSTFTLRLPRGGAVGSPVSTARLPGATN